MLIAIRGNSGLHTSKAIDRFNWYNVFSRSFSSPEPNVRRPSVSTLILSPFLPTFGTGHSRVTGFRDSLDPCQGELIKKCVKSSSLKPDNW